MTSLADIIESDEPLSMVVQGGGMRGTYSIAVLAELDSLGFRDRFENIWATSAGAMNAAYFLAGQAGRGIDVYTHKLSTKKFINLRRLRKIIDIDYLVDDIMLGGKTLDQGLFKKTKTHLHVGVTSARSGQLEWGGNRRESWSFMETLRATAALPIVYGTEVILGNDSFVDGGLVQSLPVPYAVSQKPKNLLVVMTKPLDFVADKPGRIEGCVTRRLGKMKRHSPAVVELLGRFEQHLESAMEMISLGMSYDGHTKIWAIAPSESIVSRLTSDRDRLIAAGELGRKDARTALLGIRSPSVASRPLALGDNVPVLAF